VKPINEEVDRSTPQEFADLEHYAAALRAGQPEALAALPDAYLMLWRRHQRTLAELDTAQINLADRDAKIAAHAGQSMPPEVLSAMSVRSSGMRPVLARVSGRPLVLVVPPGGVEDPHRAWERVVHRHGRLS
jgi:hypothetical protein